MEVDREGGRLVGSQAGRSQRYSDYSVLEPGRLFVKDTLDADYLE